MAEHMDSCISEAVQTTTGVDFDGEEAARERLKIPARMKGGEIGRAEKTRYPAFLGALLDVLPRCIDRTEANGECIPGYYTKQLTEVIGEGAYDGDGHKNALFLNATDVGPYPEACTNPWTATREEAMANLEVREDPEQEGCMGEDGTTGRPHAGKRDEVHRSIGQEGEKRGRKWTRGRRWSYSDNTGSNRS